MIPLPFTLLFWVRVYTPFLCFLSREYPLVFGLMVLNSLSFCLSVKLLISPSYLNEILTGNREGNGTHSSTLTCKLPWTVARQAPLSMGFSRQEYWSGWPFPSPVDLPNPGIRPRSYCTQQRSHSNMKEKSKALKTSKT